MDGHLSTNWVCCTHRATLLNVDQCQWFISHNAKPPTVLASCLLYAKRFRHPFCGNLAPISVLVWVRSFIEPDVLKTSTVRQYCSDLSDQPALEIRVRI